MTDERGYLCSCGKRGCLETVGSGIDSYLPCCGERGDDPDQ